jgi:hypothetical protein
MISTFFFDGHFWLLPNLKAWQPYRADFPHSSGDKGWHR